MIKKNNNGAAFVLIAPCEAMKDTVFIQWPVLNKL